MSWNGQNIQLLKKSESMHDRPRELSLIAGRVRVFRRRLRTHEREWVEKVRLTLSTSFCVIARAKQRETKEVIEVEIEKISKLDHPLSRRPYTSPSKSKEIVKAFIEWLWIKLLYIVRSDNLEIQFKFQWIFCHTRVRRCEVSFLKIN